jgi:chloride channel protein, CIC family
MTPAAGPSGQSGRFRRLRVLVGSLRLRLASADAMVLLCLLAVLAGLLTGVLIIVFRLLTERALVWATLLPAVEHYEALSWEWRLGLPSAGGLLIGLLFQFVPAAARDVGPAHVMTQLARHGGRLPWANGVMQFVGGALSIIAGHSVGREGPVIHLGAASASLMGQSMRLPNNSIRTLVACGVAASIAASFNTPLAGVVFAMEVVMFEYTLAGFTPVLLASVSAASLSRVVFGPDPAISVGGMQLVSLLELPWVVLLGGVIGCLSAGYGAGIVGVSRRSRRIPLWARMTAAGIFTGLCALLAPEVMGLGYDTVQSAMLGQIGLAALVLIVAAKMAATIACGGLGVPGGLIGPMVVIGAAAGGAIGIVGHWLAPGISAAPAFYATLGAVAMMGASLHAPLAALTAVLELTANPNIIMPGMAAVVTAFLVSRLLFGQEPLFVSILHSRGIDYRVDPVALALERTGVAAIMSPQPVLLDDETPCKDLPAKLSDAKWAVLASGERIRGIWPAEALAALAAKAPVEAPLSAAVGDTSPPFATVPAHATLGEALGRLDKAGADVVLVVAGAVARAPYVRGVVSRVQIESGVRYRA